MPVGAPTRTARGKPYLAGLARGRQQILWFTIGYGYQAWRALVGLSAAIGIAVLLTLGAGRADLTAAVGPTGASTPCALIDDLGLAADWSVPMFQYSDSRCDVVKTTLAAQASVAGSWVIGTFGWAFSILFVAGFTGLIRKV
jgi:hypothetical protein